MCRVVFTSTRFVNWFVCSFFGKEIIFQKESDMFKVVFGFCPRDDGLECGNYLDFLSGLVKRRDGYLWNSG